MLNDSERDSTCKAKTQAMPLQISRFHGLARPLAAQALGAGASALSPAARISSTSASVSGFGVVSSLSP